MGRKTNSQHNNRGRRIRKLHKFGSPSFHLPRQNPRSQFTPTEGFAKYAGTETGLRTFRNPSSPSYKYQKFTVQPRCLRRKISEFYLLISYVTL